MLAIGCHEPVPRPAGQSETVEGFDSNDTPVRYLQVVRTVAGHHHDVCDQLPKRVSNRTHD